MNLDLIFNREIYKKLGEKMENFINLFKETLEIEEMEIDKNLKFRDLEEWDSLAVLSVLAMINEEYDITISRDKFEKAKTVGDLYHLTQG